MNKLKKLRAPVFLRTTGTGSTLHPPMPSSSLPPQPSQSEIDNFSANISVLTSSWTQTVQWVCMGMRGSDTTRARPDPAVRRTPAALSVSVSLNSRECQDGHDCPGVIAGSVNTIERWSLWEPRRTKAPYAVQCQRIPHSSLWNYPLSKWYIHRSTTVCVHTNYSPKPLSTAPEPDKTRMSSVVLGY